MKREYNTLGTLIKKFGVREALEHKFLELRDRYPLFNRICSYGITNHIGSCAYSPSYFASWDKKGRLVSFNPDLGKTENDMKRLHKY